MLLMATTSRAAAIPVLDRLTSAPSPSPSRRFSVSFGPTTSPRSLPLRKANEMKFELRAAVGWGWGSPSDGGGRTGLLERPTFDQSQFDPLPQPQQGGDMGKLRDKVGLGCGDSYRVLLIDDSRHTANLVEKALPQAVPSVTVSDAREHFHESREKGAALVIVTVKEHAEFYAQMMVRWGLRSAIEPDSNGGGMN